MGKLDRYIVSQLLILFGFFSLTLILVYWINGAVRLFDQVIANGQSALVFLEFSSYTLPPIIFVALPISAFISAVYHGNRMFSDRELVIARATGFSPWRLARPVVVFTLLVVAMMSALGHFLVPEAAKRLAERRLEVEANVTSRFLREGQFLHPSDSATFFVREITPDGELLNIFMSDQSEAAKIAFTASKAVFFHDNENVHLLMLDGTAQHSDGKSQALTVTGFDSLVIDIDRYLSAGRPSHLNTSHLQTLQLLFPTQKILETTGRSAATLRNVAHQRIAEPLFVVGSVLVGFATLLLGGFSRTGLWPQIFLSVALVVILKSLDNFFLDIARRDPSLWFVNYAGSVSSLSAAVFILALATRGAFLGQRLKGRLS